MQENTEQKTEKVALDQDTVIGDAMCEASQLFYEAANQIARCISENAQCCIDNALLRKAELALVYMQGVVFGLAMDDAVQKWYLTEMEKSMASILNSQSLAYQPQIYVPPEPGPLMGFDGLECSGHFTFLHCLNNNTPPNAEYIKSVKEDIVKDDRLKYLFEKGLLDPTKFEGVFEKYPDLAKVKEPEAEDAPISAEDKAPKTDASTLIPPSGILQIREEAEKSTEDDNASVLNLRNLFRGGKINKSQYVGGLATLVATVLISKSEFTRLKASC